MELPVNIVVTIIIGIIIFGLGMGLFSKIYKSSDDEVNELVTRMQASISNLQCSNDDKWICSPANEMKIGDKAYFSLDVTNKGDTQDFRVEFEGIDSSNNNEYSKDGCGSIFVYYPPMSQQIMASDSGRFPFSVSSSKVTEPCSFVLTAKLIGEIDGEISRTAVIVKVK